MATEPEATGLTYEDLQKFPDDNLRREIIDGELFVTAAPSWRHQDVVRELVLLLGLYCREHGGKVLPAPTDIYLSQTNVVEPDVLVLTAQSLDRLGEDPFVPGPPDLVVEVSSPSNRVIDQTRKRDLYERFGVPEYWFVDRDVRRIEVYRLVAGRYGQPSLFGTGDSFESEALPGLAVDVSEIL